MGGRIGLSVCDPRTGRRPGQPIALIPVRARRAGCLGLRSSSSTTSAKPCPERKGIVRAAHCAGEAAWVAEGQVEAPPSLPALRQPVGRSAAIRVGRWPRGAALRAVGDDRPPGPVSAMKIAVRGPFRGGRADRAEQSTMMDDVRRRSCLRQQTFGPRKILVGLFTVEEGRRGALRGGGRLRHPVPR